MPPTLDEHRTRPARAANGHWWARVMRDLQFWIPIVVLIGGLLVLRWVS